MDILRIDFDRGTVRLRGAPAAGMPGVVWDERVQGFRCAAYRYWDIVALAAESQLVLDDRVGPQSDLPVSPWRTPELRPYQQDALRAFHAFGSRGVVSLPTGSGKTLVAIAALACAGVSSLVLCPTRALVEQWVQQLRSFYDGPVGVVSDGIFRVTPVSVMTFESAYRRLDMLGDRFRALVVDEVHHFAGGIRAEALEMCIAPIRLGLTATGPELGSPGDACLRALVGPTVCEVSIRALLGTHLADLELIRLHVHLDAEEASEYARLYRPFAEMRRCLARADPDLDWSGLVRAMARSEEGRKVFADYRRAVALATFPRAKKDLCAILLTRHRDDKKLVFTASVDDAYAISFEHLVPLLTAETQRKERDEILERFRNGRYRTLVSARVLNEGIDVPDARVGIVLGGRLGRREHIQRIGRVLRPAPGKRALIYELVTAGTIDDRRARARRRHDAAGAAAGL
ncbi:DEAD/DEAH box helicase family protein [Pendulispora rubella]|uniref:DEAD/DEAH box helicase family protein n=1 Tax=Pendulispora rubella TaxID=2741070 RepID=A0ABZ2KWR0_9BACT